MDATTNEEVLLHGDRPVFALAVATSAALEASYCVDHWCKPARSRLRRDRLAPVSKRMKVRHSTLGLFSDTTQRRPISDCARSRGLLAFAYDCQNRSAPVSVT